MKKKIGDLTLREISELTCEKVPDKFCNMVTCHLCSSNFGDIDLDEEIEVHGIEENVDLALKLSKIVHDKCKDVPHDIGITLANAIIGLGIEVQE